MEKQRPENALPRKKSITPAISVFTITSSSFDLTKTKDIAKMFKESEFLLQFPMRISSGCCQDTLVIRALDDFPYKSKVCKCGKCYLLKLIKVSEDGKTTQVLR